MAPLATRIAKDVVRETAVNTAMGLPWVRRWRVNRGRTAPSFTGEDALLDRYAFQALRGIERYAGGVTGKSIVEFGPGDTLSTGLAMLAAGARRYVALDRFVPDYSAPSAKRWYIGLSAAWETAFPGRPWPQHLRPELFPEQYPDLIGCIRGSVEEASHDATYDVVSSWQVGEHVRDISSFAALTARLLRPDGLAVHRVDFGPHDCWRTYGDPLTFLSIPDPIWSAMGCNRGTPNRARHHDFLSAWKASGLEVECHEFRHFSPSELNPDRYRPAFRDGPRASLLVRDVVYVCRHQTPAAIAG
jgi:hypothetical protein